MTEPITRRPLPLVVPAVLAALLLVALAVGGVQLWRGRDLSDPSAARDQAIAAASQLAVNFTTLDYRTFDRDSQRVLDGSTGTFRKEFVGGKDQMKSLVTQNQAVTKGKVLDVGLVSLDGDSARAIVVVDAEVTNSATTTPAARHYRVQLDLDRSGSRWLASQLQFVG